MNCAVTQNYCLPKFFVRPIWFVCIGIFLLTSCMGAFSSACLNAEGELLLIRSDDSDCVVSDLENLGELGALTQPGPAVASFAASGGVEQAVLVWTNPDDDSVASLVLMWENDANSSDAGMRIFRPVSANTDMTHVVSGLTSAASYTFTIRTRDAENNASDNSASASARIDSASS